MSKCSGMHCCMCNDLVEDAEHITVTESEDLESINIVVMCSKCHDKAKQFFDGGKKNGKSR